MWGTYRTFGLFFTPLSDEFGWSSAAISGAFSFTYLLFGFLAIVTGRLADKLGPRVVLVACSLFLGSGYLLMSQVNSIWQLYLFYGVAVGIGNSGDVAAISTLARWFVKKRGTVTGITKAGAGLGMLIIPLLANWLISSYGWRNAYVFIGIISMVVLVAASLFLKRDPGQIGQHPDGATEPEEAVSGVGVRQFSLQEVVGIRQFWIFAAVWFFINFCTQVVMLHIAPHVIEQGISTTVAATILGAIGGASILGRIGMGGVSDKLGRKATFIMAISVLSAALIWVQFAREAWMFYLFAALYGIAHGASFTLATPMLAELFGVGSLGAIFGAVMFVGTIGGAIGPVISGRIFDITGSYQLGFLLSFALSIIAAVLMLFLRPTSNKAPKTQS
jgi:MFS family permease